MKAAVLRQYGRFDIEDVSLDAPRADEVRVRTVASGLCHSDYHMMTGDFPMPLPAIAGHEAAGVVEAVGADVGEFRLGDLVVTCASAFCGQCPQCQTGHNHRCDAKPARAWPSDPRIFASEGPVYQIAGLGAFAEEMLVHRSALVKLPEGMPVTSAALMGCAVLTGVGAVLNGAKVTAGSTVAVIGCGGVGLNVVQGARIAGAVRIIAVDLSAEKLAIARAFGATDTLLAGPDAVAQLIELTRGGVDYAFEVVGLPATMREACLMLRKGGTAVLVGMTKKGAELTIPAEAFLFREIRVIGTLMGSSPFQLLLPKLGDFYRAGTLRLDELVSETILLGAINQGYAKMADGRVSRVVMTF